MSVGASSDRSDSPPIVTLERIHVGPLIEWIRSIPWEDWPRLAGAPERPAMVNDPLWHSLALRTSSVRMDLLHHFPGARCSNVMLSAVMPGAEISPHADRQAEGWITRIHVPLTSNPKALFYIEGVEHQLQPGLAYAIDVRRIHAVSNAGDTPRIHLMWDVVA
jgi:Aspartyl/Asparaginyl beta-hydroxylase